MPQISIIIPAYNAAPFIAETLASVTAQTFRDFEVIVVDDGSGDDTAEIVRAWASEVSFPVRLIQQSNAGVSAARNAGWRAATADWVQFLDADDFIHPEKLALQFAECGELSDSVAYVTSNWAEVRVTPTERRHIRNVDCQLLPQVPSEMDVLALCPTLTLAAHLFRRVHVARISGFDIGLKVDEDLEFFLRLARLGLQQHYVSAETPLFTVRQQIDRRLGEGNFKYSAVDAANQFVGNVLRVCDGDSSTVEHLSATARRSLDGRLSLYLRLMCRYDRGLFRQRLPELEAHLGRVLPTNPGYLRVLSRLIGFERAEDVASVYRRIKTIMGVYHE